MAITVKYGPSTLFACLSTGHAHAMNRSTSSEGGVTRRGRSRSAPAGTRSKQGPGTVAPAVRDEADVDALDEMVAPDDLATLEAPAEALLVDEAAPEALAEDDGPAPEDDDEEEEEVEPGLDALLTGILAPDERAAGEDDDGEDAASGLEIEYVPTARRDEFVCSACFLIWNRRQLADAGRRLCLDCIEDIGRAPAAAA